MKNVVKLAGASLVLMAALGGHAQAAEEHPAVKRPFDLPPSADLSYSISARQHGFNLSGEALVTWRASAGKYSVNAESRVAMLGKLTENRSTGIVDGYGLAPTEYYDKRFRKDPTTAAFDRNDKTITFSQGDKNYPIKGGEQDRASVSWQLVAIARAAKDKFKPGSEWQFFVVGPHDADPWTFRVVGREKVQAGPSLGEVDAVHVMRAPPPDSKDQTLDIWLAPGHEWYPVKLRFTDNDRDYVEQTLERIVKK